MSYSKVAVFRVFFFPALGGLLFGYDIGATSYVVQQLGDKKAGVSWSDLASTPVLQGLITSGGVAGAFLGALVVFKIADELGRRREMLVGASLMVAGALSEFAAASFIGLGLLLFGRLVYGLGCGLVMHGAPAYIGEMAPSAIRGSLVSLKEAMIVVGISLGYAVGFAFSTEARGWRFTYGASVPVALVFFEGVRRLPPSARWLLLRRRDAEAKEALRFLYPKDAEAVEAAFNEAIAGRDDTASSRSLLDMRYRGPLVAGLGVVLLQQFTGQPSVLYYASTIFADAGIADVATILIGLFKLAATLGAVVAVDRRGRRELLLVGCAVMLVALLGLSAAFYGLDLDVASSSITPRKAGIVLLLFLYIAGYQYGFGPVAWLLISEIFPLEVRGQAVALAVQANFASNLIVTFLFPVAQTKLKSAVGPKFTFSALFFIFACVDLYAIRFVYLYLPETKGLSLEQVEALFLKQQQQQRRHYPDTTTISETPLLDDDDDIDNAMLPPPQAP